jgi:cytidylate kinase
MNGTMLGGAAGSGSNPLSSFLANPSGLLVLDVGGKIFRTSLNTLLAVQGSLFWQVRFWV